MSGKKNFLPEKINSSKKNYTIDGTGCSLRNSVSAMPFPFLAFVAFGTRKGLLRYGRDTRCAKQPPVVRDAFSEALRAQNRLLGYGSDIRYRKRPPTVRDAFSMAQNSRLRRLWTAFCCTEYTFGCPAVSKPFHNSIQKWQSLIRKP